MLNPLFEIALTIPADPAPSDADVRINLIDESSGQMLAWQATELARVKIIAR